MAKAPDGFYIGTDTQISIKGLKDVNGQYVNNATVVGVLQDRTGKVVVGCENLSFSYVIDRNGEYVGVIPATSALKESTEYDLVITCTNSNRRMTITYRRSAAVLYA